MRWGICTNCLFLYDIVSSGRNGATFGDTRLSEFKCGNKCEISHRNFDKFLPDRIASHLRRQYPSAIVTCTC